MAYGILVRIDNEPASRAPRPNHFDHHPYVPGKCLAELPDVLQLVDELRSQHRRLKARKNQTGLSQNAGKLLELMSLHPFTPCSRLWPQIGTVAFVTQKATYRILTELDFVLFEDVRLGKTNQLFWEILEAGFNHLGVPVQDIKGHGDNKHTWLCYWLLEAGKRRHYEVALEPKLEGTGHIGDVSWRRAAELHLLECVVTATSNVIDHARACFLECRKVDTLTFVATQKKELTQIEKQIKGQVELKSFVDRIHYLPAESLLKELWP